MDKKLIEKFYEELILDGDVRKILSEKMRKYGDLLPEERTKKILNELIIPKSRELGYNFTMDDLIQYEKKLLKKGTKISLEDLEGVAGGVSPRLAAASFMSLTALSSVLGVGSFFTNFNPSNLVKPNSVQMSNSVESANGKNRNVNNSNADKFNVDSNINYDNKDGHKVNLENDNFATPKKSILNRFSRVKSIIDGMANKIIKKEKDKLENWKIGSKNSVDKVVNNKDFKVQESNNSKKENINLEPGVSDNKKVAPKAVAEVLKENSQKTNIKEEKLLKAAQNMTASMDKLTNEIKEATEEVEVPVAQLDVKKEANQTFGFLDEIRQGKKLRHVEVNENKDIENENEPGKGITDKENLKNDFLEEIRQGKKLKPVNQAAENQTENNKDNAIKEEYIDAKKGLKHVKGEEISDRSSGRILAEREFAEENKAKQNIAKPEQAELVIEDEAMLPKGELAVEEEVKEGTIDWERAVPGVVSEEGTQAEVVENNEESKQNHALKGVFAELIQGKKLKHVEVNENKNKSEEAPSGIKTVVQTAQEMGRDIEFEKAAEEEAEEWKDEDDSYEVKHNDNKNESKKEDNLKDSKGQEPTKAVEKSEKTNENEKKDVNKVIEDLADKTRPVKTEKMEEKLYNHVKGAMENRRKALGEDKEDESEDSSEEESENWDD